MFCCDICAIMSDEDFDDLPVMSMRIIEIIVEDDDATEQHRIEDGVWELLAILYYNNLQLKSITSINYNSNDNCKKMIAIFAIILIGPKYSMKLPLKVRSK